MTTTKSDADIRNEILDGVVSDEGYQRYVSHVLGVESVLDSSLGQTSKPGEVEPVGLIRDLVRRMPAAKRLAFANLLGLRAA